MGEFMRHFILLSPNPPKAHILKLGHLKHNITNVHLEEPIYGRCCPSYWRKEVLYQGKSFACRGRPLKHPVVGFGTVPQHTS
jgi:hypothetical protein